jgi:hypothetical protein
VVQLVVTEGFDPSDFRSNRNEPANFGTQIAIKICRYGTAATAGDCKSLTLRNTGGSSPSTCTSYHD